MIDSILFFFVVLTLLGWLVFKLDVFGTAAGPHTSFSSSTPASPPSSPSPSPSPNPRERRALARSPSVPPAWSLPGSLLSPPRSPPLPFRHVTAAGQHDTFLRELDTVGSYGRMERVYDPVNSWKWAAVRGGRPVSPRLLPLPVSRPVTPVPEPVVPLVLAPVLAPVPPPPVAQQTPAVLPPRSLSVLELLVGIPSTPQPLLPRPAEPAPSHSYSLLRRHRSQYLAVVLRARWLQHLRFRRSSIWGSSFGRWNSTRLLPLPRIRRPDDDDNEDHDSLREVPGGTHGLETYDAIWKAGFYDICAKRNILLDLNPYLPGSMLANFESNLNPNEKGLRTLANLLRWQYESGRRIPAGGSKALADLITILSKVDGLVTGFVSDNGGRQQEFSGGDFLKWARAWRYCQRHFWEDHKTDLQRDLAPAVFQQLQALVTRHEAHWRQFLV
jgi:hypothetical protein